MTGVLPDRQHSAIGVALLFLLTGALLAPDGAEAQFVLYHSNRGDWTVTCARDLMTARVTCTMTAPPPALSQNRPSATIAIDATAGETPAVSFHLPGGVDPTRPVLALIDAGAPVMTESNRLGEGGWRGAAAESLIQAMHHGNRLNLVWSVIGDPNPRAAGVALHGFDESLRDYRQKLAAFGIAASR